MFFRSFFVLVLLFIQSVCSAELLKEKLTSAKAGDYFVFSYHKHATLLLIREISEEDLVIEEITGPLQILNQYRGEWQKWLEAGATLHTSWTISDINLKTGDLKWVFSVPTHEFISSIQDFSFLPKLLTLPLQNVNQDARKRIGPEPMPGEIDMRKLWLPKIWYKGELVTPTIEVKEVNWPHDTSALSGKHIDLYIPQSNALTYFPYWIEIRGNIGKFRIGVEDSGSDLHSPISTIPEK